MDALSLVYVQHPSTAKDWKDVAFGKDGISLYALVLLMESISDVTVLQTLVPFILIFMAGLVLFQWLFAA